MSTSDERTPEQQAEIDKRWDALGMWSLPATRDGLEAARLVASRGGTEEEDEIAREQAKLDRYYLTKTMARHAAAEVRERGGTEEEARAAAEAVYRAEVEKVTLAIKLNNTASNDPCALCGTRTDPDVGPELFLDGTWELVCYECGKQHAPQLVNLLVGARYVALATVQGA